MVIDRQIISPSSGNLSLDGGVSRPSLGREPQSGDFPVSPYSQESFSSGGVPSYDPARWATRDDYYKWLYDTYGITTHKIDSDGTENTIGAGTDDVPDPLKTDSSASAADNLVKMQQELQNLFSLGSFALDGGSLFNGSSYINFLQTSFSALKDFYIKYYDDLAGKSAFWQIAEKVCDTSQKFLDTYFNQILSYKSWYMQQDYNTPANQLKRLEEAGLSSAFFFGNLSSGNAQSAPAVQPAELASPSNAGQVMQTDRAANLQYDVGNKEATAALLTAGVDSFKTLAEANNIRQMTPIQVASAMQQFKNLGVTFDYLNTEMFKIQNDVASDWFKNDFASWQQEVSNSESNVSQAQKDLEIASTDNFALSMKSFFMNKESYTGTVRSTTGERIVKSYSMEQLQDAFRHGGFDEEGNQVFTKADIMAGLKANTGFNVLVAKGGVDASLQSGLSAGRTDSSKHGVSSDVSQSHSSSSGDEDNRHLSVTVGSQKFTRTQERHLVMSKQYCDYMDKLRKSLLDARDKYYMLTTGERARVFQNYQLYLENKASGLSHAAGFKFRDAVKRLLSTPVDSGD